MTAKQAAVRASLAAGSTAWRTLTAAQRSAWIAFGLLISRTDTLGRVYTLTGIQAFLLTRRNLFTVGAAYIVAPPAYAPPNALTTFSVASALSVLTATFTPTPLGANEHIVIQATRPLSAGVVFTPRAAYKQVFVGAAASASPQVITAQYAAIFGTPPLGTRLNFRAYVVNDLTGLASAIIENFVIAA